MTKLTNHVLTFILIINSNNIFFITDMLSVACSDDLKDVKIQRESTRRLIHGPQFR